MSSTPTSRLKESVMESKISIDAVMDTLKILNQKNAELVSSKKIDFPTSMKLNELLSKVYNLIEEDRLKEAMDQIVSTSTILSVAPYYALDESIKSRDYTDLLMVIRDLGFSINTLFEKPLPSVMIGTEKDPEQRSKSIDNILYSYTPFKLRGTSGKYSMLFLPSTRGPQLSIKWCDDDARTTFDGSTKVLTPNSITLTNVNELKSIVTINGEQGFRLEVDRRSPTASYYCKMGLYISPQSTCNRRECYLWDPCQGKKFWKGPKTFYSLSRVSPDMAVKIERYDAPVTLQSNRFGLSAETVDNLQVKIYIDSVVFYSSYLARTPQIKLKDAPGYKITTRGIAFSIDSTWVKKFVENVLNDDPEVFAWIFAKHFVSTNYNVNDLRRVTAFFGNIINDKSDTKTSDFARRIKQAKVDPELVDFGIRLLIHSLAHLVHEEVVSLLQTSPKNLVYSFSEKPETDGKYRVFIIENAERGLGLTQSFAALVSKQPNYLSDLATKANEILALCSRTSLGFSPPTSASSDVRMVWDHVSRYNRIFQLKFGISMPIEFVRYILSQYDAATSKVVERDDIAPYLDDILSASSLCWDGCYHCVRLESDCHDAPYEQIFDVSKSLLAAFLNEWRGTFEKPKVGPKGTTIVQIGEAKKLLTYIKSAKDKVTIVSPWFSKQVAQTIRDLAVREGTKFSILTSDDKNNETHVEALRIFSSSKAAGLDVRVLTERFPHIKMTIIDESLLIMGSANLTLSGLYENIEGYVIVDDAEAIGKALKSFSELWDRAAQIEIT